MFIGFIIIIIVQFLNHWSPQRSDPRPIIASRGRRRRSRCRHVISVSTKGQSPSAVCSECARADLPGRLSALWTLRVFDKGQMNPRAIGGAPWIKEAADGWDKRLLISLRGPTGDALSLSPSLPTYLPTELSPATNNQPTIRTEPPARHPPPVQTCRTSACAHDSVKAAVVWPFPLPGFYRFFPPE